MVEAVSSWAGQWLFRFPRVPRSRRGYFVKKSEEKCVFWAENSKKNKDFGNLTNFYLMMISLDHIYHSKLCFPQGLLCFLTSDWGERWLDRAPGSPVFLVLALSALCNGRRMRRYFDTMGVISRYRPQRNQRMRESESEGHPGTRTRNSHLSQLSAHEINVQK